MAKNTRTTTKKSIEESVPKKKKKKTQIPEYLRCMHKNAAGIDIGATEHYVAVPEGRDEVNVRSFKSFTSDLNSLADWLKKCGVETVAMESTGVYWIPLYELLEERGFEVRLVDARHVKNVSGRKTDVQDCQWLQQLHTFGLLAGAFRPDDSICHLRIYHRQREMLTQYAAMHIQHMQKALSQMNVQLHNVVNDITGVTGMAIIRAIAEGERDVKRLSEFRDRRCKNSKEVIEKSLEGHYREEHVFALKQAVELFDVYGDKIRDCDQAIDKLLSTFEDKVDLTKVSVPEKKRESSQNAPHFDLHAHLFRITGVNLMAIPGINSLTAFKVVSEIGLDMNRWNSEKHFASWLGLCPGNKVSGGKRLSGKSKPTGNRAAAALRFASLGLAKTQTALGAFYRRQKARLGAPKALTATAHKLAYLFYNMLKYGMEYVEKGQTHYEEKYKERMIRNLHRNAKALGYNLVEVA